MVTDILEGKWYLVARDGSEFELMLPYKGEYVRVRVDSTADITEVAEELGRQLASEGIRGSEHPNVINAQPVQLSP